MESCDLETSVADWVIEHPESLRLFESLGIDYCCGGKSLGFECHRQGLDPQHVLAQLRQLAGRRATPG